MILKLHFVFSFFAISYISAGKVLISIKRKHRYNTRAENHSSTLGMFNADFCNSFIAGVNSKTHLWRVTSKLLLLAFPRIILLPIIIHTICSNSSTNSQSFFKIHIHLMVNQFIHLLFIEVIMFFKTLWQVRGAGFGRRRQR